MHGVSERFYFVFALLLRFLFYNDHIDKFTEIYWNYWRVGKLRTYVIKIWQDIFIAICLILNLSTEIPKLLEGGETTNLTRYFF